MIVNIDSTVSDKGFLPAYYPQLNNFYTEKFDSKVIYDKPYQTIFEAKGYIPITLDYPIHLTLKNELEKLGLSILDFEVEEVEDKELITFELTLSNTDLNVLEYELIKKFDLIKKKVVLTLI